MQIRNVLTADEGYTLTDGHIYGKIVFLAEERTANEFHEITDEEYRKIMKKNEEAVLGEGGLE